MIMALTVWPNEDGTIDIHMPGSEPVTYNADDVEACSLPEGEKRFLRQQLRYARPCSSSACATGD